MGLPPHSSDFACASVFEKHAAPGSARARVLRQQPGRKLLIVWDNPRVHRAAQTTFAPMHRSVDSEHLPPYAPKATPVDFLRAHSKGYELASYVALGKAELGDCGVDTLRGTRRLNDVLAGCCHGAGLEQ